MCRSPACGHGARAGQRGDCGVNASESCLLPFQMAKKLDMFVLVKGWLVPQRPVLGEGRGTSWVKATGHSKTLKEVCHRGVFVPFSCCFSFPFLWWMVTHVSPSLPSASSACLTFSLPLHLVFIYSSVCLFFFWSRLYAASLSLPQVGSVLPTVACNASVTGLRVRVLLGGGCRCRPLMCSSVCQTTVVKMSSVKTM